MDRILHQVGDYDQDRCHMAGFQATLEVVTRKTATTEKEKDNTYYCIPNISVCR
jgi:hypothetical protein